MSAWIVSKTHIDALVHAGIDAEMVRPDEADEFGRMLWRENLASVAHRYPYDKDGERPGPISFRDADVDTYTFEYLDGGPGASRKAPGVVYMAAACYDYQTCKHPEYDGSKAELFARALCKLTEDIRHDGGPWGVADRSAFLAITASESEH